MKDRLVRPMAFNGLAVTILFLFRKLDADIQQDHQGRVRCCRRCQVDVERKFAEAMARARHGVA